MTQKKVEVKKAGVNKELKLSNGWILEKTSFDYSLSGKRLNVFIHGDQIRFNSKNKTNAWLSIYQNDVYIGSLWIDNAIEIENIKKFIKV